MKSYQQFFAELKRRHVFKVSAIYGVTAFGLLQVADLLVAALQLPADFLTMITVLVLLGFPIALIVAWAFELTPEGVRRTDMASREELEELVAQPASSRWPAGLLALTGVAALVLGAWWVGRSTAPRTTVGDGNAAAVSETHLAYADPADDQRPALAVLPFADMSPQGDQEYFSDGITEELLNALARVRDVKVAARTSAFAFKDADLTAEELGDTLRVRYLVEGSVRKAGDQLRITAQLIDTSDGSHLWSEQYDRRLDDVFAIQTEIAQAVAAALRVPLGLGDGARLVSPTDDFEAYDLYLAGRARLRERGSSVGEAIGLFEAAIQRDSAWAPAWAGLAEATEIALWHPDRGGERREAGAIADGLADAERAALRALELDSRNGSAHVALGNVLRDRFEFNDGERRYREALAIDPDNAEAHQQYAELLIATGRIGEAVLAAARSVVLDPAAIRLNMLGAALALDDRPVEAQHVFELGIAADPQRRVGGLHRNLGGLHYVAGRYAEAGEVWRPFEPGAAAEFDEAWPLRAARMESGDLEAFPHASRREFEPFEWMMLGFPDSAALAMARPPGGGIELNRLYAVWMPILDPARPLPAAQDYLRRHGLSGVEVQRTDPGERELPAVLREGAPDN